jgi:hypothetical protein
MAEERRPGFYFDPKYILECPEIASIFQPNATGERWMEELEKEWCKGVDKKDLTPDMKKKCNALETLAVKVTVLEAWVKRNMTEEAVATAAPAAAPKAKRAKRE